MAADAASLGSRVHERLQASPYAGAVQDQPAAVAVALHFALLQRGFKCTGSKDEGAVRGFAAPTEQVSDSDFLPKDCLGSPELVHFRYSHPEAAGSTFIVKVLHMGSSSAVHAVCKGNSETHQGEVTVERVASTAPSADAPGWFAPLQQSANAEHLEACVAHIVHGLVPSIQLKAQAAAAQAEASAAKEEANAAKEEARAARRAAARNIGQPSMPGLPASMGGVPSSLVGPDHPMFTGPAPGGFPAVDPLTGLPTGPTHPGHQPGLPGIRFDPMGPGVPGFSGPDHDHMAPPSMLDPELRGGRGRGRGRGGVGGFGGAFGGGPGFF